MSPNVGGIKDVLNPSMYILNKTGDSIPPCFTPFDTLNKEENVSPSNAHLLVRIPI